MKLKRLGVGIMAILCAWGILWSFVDTVRAKAFVIEVFGFHLSTIPFRGISETQVIIGCILMWAVYVLEVMTALFCKDKFKLIADIALYFMACPATRFLVRMLNEILDAKVGLDKLWQIAGAIILILIIATVDKDIWPENK